jgi:hypothetical protein
VEQSRGDVFYRVDPADPFVVRTGSGTVTVVGTCFRVEVMDMNSIIAGAIGSAAGALVASTVLVTVYEGKVATASPEGALTVEAGERAEMAPGKAPVKRLIIKEKDAPEAAVLEPIDEAAIDPAKLPERLRVLSREKAALQQEVAALRAELQKAKVEPRETRMFDIPQEELLQMAENCEVRWDLPGIGGPPQTIDPKDLEKLELSPDEAEVVDRHMEQSQALMLEEVRKAYVAITGEENTGTMAGEAMFAEIRDKTTEQEVKRLFQALSRERAGLQPKPPEGAQMTPFERMFRALAGEGDRLEQAIAAELGPEVARRARDHHKGWGNRHRNRAGCP